jgi:hypothetical protein
VCRQDWSRASNLSIQIDSVHLIFPDLGSTQTPGTNFHFCAVFKLNFNKLCGPLDFESRLEGGLDDEEEPIISERLESLLKIVELESVTYIESISGRGGMTLSNSKKGRALSRLHTSFSEVPHQAIP